MDEYLKESKGKKASERNQYKEVKKLNGPSS